MYTTTAAASASKLFASLWENISAVKCRFSVFGRSNTLVQGAVQLYGYLE